MKRLAIILAFGLGFSQYAKTQAASDLPPEPPVFSTEVGVVNISVVVLDKNNKPLPRLNKNNFRVKERRANERYFREIDISLDQPERLSLRGGIILDTSGSTTDQFRYQLDVASEVVKWIIRTINDKNRGDKFFVAEFYYETLDLNPAEGLFTIKQDWTDDVNALVGAIIRKTKKAAGASPLFGGISSAAQKFKNEHGGNFANFLIVIADGQNNLPFSDLKNSTYLAQSVNLPVYTIGTVSHKKIDPSVVFDFEQNLKQISVLTGGRFFDMPGQDKLPQIAKQILLDLKNQYRLSYKLSSDYKNGDNVRVVIEVGNTDSSGKWRPMAAKLLYGNSYRVIKKN